MVERGVAEARLVAEGLGLSAGARWLVEGVSLTLRPGEVLGLIGPNGAGKSTLLRMLAGLLRPSAGEVRLDGAPLLAMPASKRARGIGYLPQHFAPHWDYTARQLLRLGLERAGMAADLDAAARRFHLGEALLAQRWSTLSGGERGRMLAAMVLAPNPSVILADEATAALDIGQAARLVAMLRDAAEAGAAVALVAHDLNLALMACDRLLLLEDGRGVLEGAPGTVGADTRLDAAFGVAFERSTLHGRLRLLPAGPWAGTCTPQPR